MQDAPRYRRKAGNEWDDIMYCKARGEAQIVRGHCDTIDFVKQLFQYDATDRISIQEALAHPYIRRVIEPMGSQKKCPFRVKKDMMQVEDLSHQQLIKIMKQDVRSAKNSYNEMSSGSRWMAGHFQHERTMELASGEHEMSSSSPRSSSNGTLSHILLKSPHLGDLELRNSVGPDNIEEEINKMNETIDRIMSEGPEYDACRFTIPSSQEYFQLKLEK